MQDMELNARKASFKELDGVDLAVFEQVQDSIFPRVVDGLPVEQKALELTNRIAKEPIKNIRWVSRDLIEASEFMSNPRAIVAQQEGWGKFELVGKSADAYNDYIKATLLQLNPQYYTANFIGNMALNVMHQGVFAPLNLAKASHLSANMDVGLVSVFDDLLGSGITHLADFRFGSRTPLNAINILASKLVDTIPRRAAGLHEARKLGYKSINSFEQLMKRAIDEGNEEARKELIYIARRANDAIIDYERLNPFEKKVVSRVIFIYPWIKGSTRYMLRFPAEHPVQAAAFALLYQRQQELADQKLGERPWYAEVNIPLGINVERYGEEYPLTLNPKQIVPFTTQYELGRTAEGFARGIENRQPLIDIASPLLGNLATALTGKRAFDDQDVDRSAGTFLSESLAIPWRDRWEALTQADEVRAERAPNRLYPRNFADEVLKAALGTLAPTPYNREKGEWIARGHRGVPPALEWKKKLEQAEELRGMKAPQEIWDAVDAKVEWEKVKDEAHKRKKDLSDEELAKLKFEMLVRLKPEYTRYRSEAMRAIEDPFQLSKADARIDALLGWNELEKISEMLNFEEKRKAKEALQHSG